MASNRFSNIRAALGRFLGSPPLSESVTAAGKKPSALPESKNAPKKPASSDEQKAVVRATQKSSFEQIPPRMQQYCLSFLNGGEKLAFLRAGHQLFTMHSNLVHPARAQQALSNLVHRLSVEKTLAAIKSKPDILEALQPPFKLTVTGYGGHTVTRLSLMSALDALDEYDVAKPDAKAEPCAIIPSIRAQFRPDHPAQALIDQQIAGASDAKHQLETQERHLRYLAKIRKFILEVIKDNDISGDSKSNFDSNMNTKLVQDFIQTAFQLEESDNGEFGVVLDVWQLLHDYVYLFNQYIDVQDMLPDTVREDAEQPILGRYWGRKAWIVDSAVYLAVHHFAQLCHLEVLDAGAEPVAKGEKRPTRFNMRDKEVLKRLEDIRAGTHVFGFFSGTKYGPVGPTLGVVTGWGAGQGPEGDLQNFCQTKTAAKTRAYAATRVPQEVEVALANEGLPSSPTATAARR